MESRRCCLLPWVHGLGQPVGSVGMQLGTLSLSPYGRLCAGAAFSRRAEVEGNEEATCVFLCVCVLPHQKCQHCSTYLFVGSLLSPAVAQGGICSHTCIMIIIGWLCLCGCMIL